jgi:exopolyphosphatase/guanosine-5'-triphosphate,3'-diphosphate pyrophosphatase
LGDRCREAIGHVSSAVSPIGQAAWSGVAAQIEREKSGVGPQVRSQTVSRHPYAQEVPERRTAVIDLGSNSFRLVVFTSDAGWWRRTDEIYEAVRIGEGMAATAKLGDAPMQRGLATVELFAHFCRATGLEAGDVDAVATSAIRSARNGRRFLDRAKQETGLPMRVLSEAEEARYGYLAAVNSTTLSDGVVLDLGGGSMQLVQVGGREARELSSWPLGAVRMTERFLPDDRPARGKQLKALRAHVREALASAPWLDEAPRIVGIGGTVRNLATAAQYAAALPTFGVQGFTITRDALDDLVEELAGRPPADRAKVPGIKAARADVILAGATVIQAVLAHTGLDGIEVTEAGLREGVFFERHCTPTGMVDDVRRSSVENLHAQFNGDDAHVEHVAKLALGMFDELAAEGLHDGDPRERELLWAAAKLHDIGVHVDYDDHHKHSRYLILNAGLPGWTQREIGLVAQIARYHRKGVPSIDALGDLVRKGDRDLLGRCAAILRLAEHLERSRDQLVRAAHVEVHDGAVELRLEGGGDVSLARWAAQRETELFERTFSRPLAVR